MKPLGIAISIAALACGIAGAVFVFWGYNRYNRGKHSKLHFILAIIGGVLFAGLLYLGGKLGLLW